MWLKKDAPEVYTAQQAFVQAKESFTSAPQPLGNTIVRMFIPDMERIPEMLGHLNSLEKKVMDQVSQVELPPRAIRRFLESIETDLKNPNFGFISVTSDSDVSIYIDSFEDWFLRTENEVGDFPNSHIKYSLLHIDLFDEAKRIWRTNPKVRFVQPLDKAIKRTSPKAPRDTPHVLPLEFRDSDHTWMHEALAVAEAGVVALGFDFNLSDYVEFKPRMSIPYLSVVDEGRAPILFESASFGHRLLDRPGLTSKTLSPTWRTEQGTFIAPFWQYLTENHFADSSTSDIAKAIGSIGAGIDAVIRSEDPYKESLPKRIFCAGEAVMKLRAKFELKEHVETALASKAKNRKKGQRSGSTERQQVRVEMLLDEMGRISESQALQAENLEETLAEAAWTACKARDPKLWKQGGGQLKSYLADVRSGKYGKDAQDQLKIILNHNKQYLSLNYGAKTT